MDRQHSSLLKKWNAWLLTFCLVASLFTAAVPASSEELPANVTTAYETVEADGNDYTITEADHEAFEAAKAKGAISSDRISIAEPSLAEESAPFVLDDAAEEAQISVAETSLSILKGERTELTVGATGYQGSVSFRVSTMGNQVKAGWTKEWDGTKATLTVKGLEQGQSFLNILLCDASGTILASKTLKVTVTENLSATKQTYGRFAYAYSSLDMKVGDSQTIVPLIVSLDCAADIRVTVYGSGFSATLGDYYFDSRNDINQPITVQCSGSGSAYMTLELTATTGELLDSRTIYLYTTTMSLNKSSLTVKKGYSATVKVTPNHLVGSAYVSCTSSNSNVSVQALDWENGSMTLKITGKAVGKTTLTIKLMDVSTGAAFAGCTKSFQVTVSQAFGVSFAAKTATVKTKQYITLKAALKGFNATKYELVAKSSNTHVSVYVSSKTSTTAYVRVTGKTVGTATVSLVMRRRSDKKTMATGTSKITVKSSAKMITTGFSKASLKRNHAKECTVKFYNIPSSGVYWAKTSSPSRVYLSWKNKKHASATLKILPRRKGKAYVTIYMGNSSHTKVYVKKTITVTITDTGVVDYTYSFSNSGSVFGMNYNSKYPLSVFTRMYGDNWRARVLQRSQTYGGNCYGMTATSALMYVRNMAAYFGKYQLWAKNLSISSWSSKLGMSLKTFIESAHMMQFEQNTANREYSRRKYYNVSHVMAELKKGHPVMIGLWSNGGGHEILGYGIKYYAGKAYINVYDPNYPNEARSIKCNIDGSDAEYYINDTYYVYAYDYSTYAEISAVWDKRGRLTPNSGYLSGYGTSNLLIASSDDFTVVDEEGNTVATVADGQVTQAADGIVPINQRTLNADNVMMYVPEGELKVVNADASQTDFTVTMAGIDHCTEITTSASDVLLNVSDGEDTNTLTFAPAEGEDYRIAMGQPNGEELVYTGTGTGETVTAMVMTSDDGVAEIGLQTASESTAEKILKAALPILGIGAITVLD